MEVVITSRRGGNPPARTPSPKHAHADSVPPTGTPLQRCLPAPLPSRNPASSSLPPQTHSPSPFHLGPSMSPRSQAAPHYSHSGLSPYRFSHRFSPYPISYPSPVPPFPPPRLFRRARPDGGDQDLDLPCKPSPPLLIPTSLTPFRLPAAFTKKKVLSFSSVPVRGPTAVSVSVPGPVRLDLKDASRNENGNGNGNVRERTLGRRRRRRSRPCPSEKLRGGGGSRRKTECGMPSKVVVVAGGGAGGVSPSTSRFCRIGGSLGAEVEKDERRTEDRKLQSSEGSDQPELPGEEEEEVLSVVRKLPRSEVISDETEIVSVEEEEGEVQRESESSSPTGKGRIRKRRNKVVVVKVPLNLDRRGAADFGLEEEEEEEEGEVEVESTESDTESTSTSVDQSQSQSPLETELRHAHSIVNLQVPDSHSQSPGSEDDKPRSCCFAARRSPPTRRTPKEVIQMREDQNRLVQVKKKSQKRLLARIMNEKGFDEGQARSPPQPHPHPQVPLRANVVGELLFGGDGMPKKKRKKPKKKKRSGSSVENQSASASVRLRDRDRLVESKAKWIAGGGWRMPRRASGQNKTLTPTRRLPKEEIFRPRISSKNVLCGEAGIPQSTAISDPESERIAIQAQTRSLGPLDASSSSPSRRASQRRVLQVDRIRGLLRKRRQALQMARQLQICPALVVRKAHAVETVNLFPSKRAFRAPPVRVKKKRKRRKTKRRPTKRPVEKPTVERPKISSLPKPPIVQPRKRRSPRPRTDSPVTGWQVPADDTKEAETKPLLKVPARILVRDKSVEFSQALHLALRDRLEDGSADLLSLSLVPRDEYYQSYAEEIRTILQGEEDLLIASPRQ